MISRIFRGLAALASLCLWAPGGQAAAEEDWGDWVNPTLASSIVGAWTREKAPGEDMDRAITFAPDGTFEVDRDMDAKKDIWGKYSVDQDVITLIATGGDFVQPAAFGKYRFDIADGQLGFTLIEDTVQARIKDFSFAWRKKQ